jgi:hypothetical protein
MGLLSNADPAHLLQLSTLPMTTRKKTFCNGQSPEILTFLLIDRFPESRNRIYAVQTQGDIREALFLYKVFLCFFRILLDHFR